MPTALNRAFTCKAASSLVNTSMLQARVTIYSEHCCMSTAHEFCHLLQSEDGDTVFEYLVREDNAEWQHWRECVPSWKYPKEQERPKFAQLVIPTLDSVRYEKLLTLAYSVQKVGCCLLLGLGVLNSAILCFNCVGCNKLTAVRVHVIPKCVFCLPALMS